MNHSRTSKRTHHRGARKILLASLAVAALACGTTAYANDTPASGTETDTLTNRTISAHPQFSFKEGDLTAYDHPDRNLVINWDAQNGRGDGSAIRDAVVNAKNITINADFKGNQWDDKGIISDYGTHVTASGDINIKTHNDSVYTEGNGSTTIEGFKNLTIEATGNEEKVKSIFGFKIFLGYTGGYGLVDNANGITVKGGEDSTVNISTAASIQAAVGNSVANSQLGTGITISAGQINITSPYNAIFAGPGENGDFAVKMNANTVDIKGLVNASNGGTVSINPDTEGTVALTAGKGGYEKVTASTDSITSSGKGSKVTINESKGGQVKITGDVEAINNGSISINGTKAESSVQGNVLARNGTINLKLTGDSSSMKGNLTTKDYYGSKANAAITAEFSGSNTSLTGDANNAGTMHMTFNNGSAWTGNLTNTSGTSTVGLSNSSRWTGNLTNTSGDSTVSLANGSLWIGDLTNTSGTTTVNLDGSIWDGAATGDGDIGNRDITLTNGSLWALSADSFANSVNLDSGSVISLAGNAHTLETLSLGGSGGTFLMDLNYQGDDVTTYRDGDSSDYIVAHSGSGSTYGVALSGDSNVNGMTEGSKLYFATTGAGSSSFKLNQNIEVRNFNKIYNKNLSVLKDTGNLSVKKETDTTDSDFKGSDNWYLTPDTSKGHDGDTINPNGTVPGSAANAVFALWRDDDALIKRLGELRYDQQDDGIWARMVNKHLERDGSHGFKGNYKTIQVGYDKKKDTENNGSWYYGGAISHLWGDTNYTDGHGSQKETDLSIYGTNIRPHGHYLDLIARVGRIDSDYTTSYGDHGKFENWGMSLGAEYGRQKALGGGWSIEPQAQLTYHYLWGDDYTTRNGAKVNQDNADSLVGRLGFVLSREFNGGTDHAGRVYLKASILHDFLGDTASTITDDISYHDDDDLGDTWYVAGLGTDIHLGKNTRFYFDAERNFNADVKMKYRFNAGLKFGF